MAKKKQNPEVIDAAPVAPEFTATTPIESIIVTNEQFEKTEELLADPPEPTDSLKEAITEYKEAMAVDIVTAQESDKISEPSLFKDGKSLMINQTSLNGDEENDLRAVSELHFKSKGLRFRGSSLRQAQLDSLLQDPTFVGKLGRLRKYL